MADGGTGNALALLPAIQALAKQYDLDAAAFIFTFKSVAMPQPHTDPEFVSCCLVAREHGLNPLTKELFFMRTKGSGIQPIVSVDGWMKKCNQHQQFDGMKFVDNIAADGTPVSVTCIIYRKDRTHPIEVTEYFDECSKAGGPVWKTSPKRMLRHRALTQAARYAFGFAGVMDHDEFEQWQRMKDITPRQPRASTIPDIPDDTIDQSPANDVADETAFADNDATDSSALIREIEGKLNGCTPLQARGIEREYAEAISEMSEDDRTLVIEMLEAAKSGVP